MCLASPVIEEIQPSSIIGTNDQQRKIQYYSQGKTHFGQSVLNWLEKLSTLEQKTQILENATVGEFIIFKPAFENYKAQNGYNNLAA